MTLSAPKLTALAGVWQRSLLVQNGLRDDTSAVYWLQFGARAGDIRARAGQSRADSAFAGVLLTKASVFRWLPDLEHGNLTDGAPDEGRLDLVDDDLFEVGVHAPYLEHWHRVAAIEPGDLGLQFADPATHSSGLLIEIGRFAFCARPKADEGGAFVLAECEDNTHKVRLAAGCDARPGDAIDWPVVDGSTLRFPASPLGPSGLASAEGVQSSLQSKELMT